MSSADFCAISPTGPHPNPTTVSPQLRRAAYRIPEHFARHWLLLLLADRVDVLESRIAPAVSRPLERLGLGGGADFARSNPLGALAGVAGALWVGTRLVRGRSSGRETPRRGA